MELEPASQQWLLSSFGSTLHEPNRQIELSHVAAMIVAMLDGILNSSPGIASVAGRNPLAVVWFPPISVHQDPGCRRWGGVAQAVADDVCADSWVTPEIIVGCLQDWCRPE